MTYEYVCTECGHQWEAEQRISEPALSDCPTCHRSSAKRLVTGGMGFVLKGSGWYSDLYGLKPKGGSGGGDLGTAKSSSSAKTDSGDSAKSTSDTAKSSDSKPSEAKSTAKADTSAAAV